MTALHKYSTDADATSIRLDTERFGEIRKAENRSRRQSLLQSLKRVRLQLCPVEWNPLFQQFSQRFGDDAEVLDKTTIVARPRKLRKSLTERGTGHC